MNLSVSSFIYFVPILLFIEAFFSGSEIALLSADRIQLKKLAQGGSSGAEIALLLGKYPERIFSTTLLITSFCLISISAIIAMEMMKQYGSHGEWFAVALTSPLIVIFGELIPKAISQKYALQIAPWVSRPVWFGFFIFYPLTKIFSLYTHRLSRWLGPIEQLLAGKKKNTREELKALLNYTRKESKIKNSEKRMIKKIFDFKDIEAKHALIPLVKVEAISEDTTVHEAIAHFERHRHSRMPIYQDRIDNVIGILEVGDLFSSQDLQSPVRNLLKSAHYVSETQSLEDLLHEMNAEQNEMVIVVDEYGGAVGVLTFEDIVEEIVGEIEDEYDTESTLYQELDPNRWVVQGRISISTLNEAIQIELPLGEYETLGGFLLQQFGRIPAVKDELIFDTLAGSYSLTIRNANDRQIKSVLIKKIITEDETSKS